MENNDQHARKRSDTYLLTRHIQELLEIDTTVGELSESAELSGPGVFILNNVGLEGCKKNKMNKLGSEKGGYKQNFIQEIFFQDVVIVDFRSSQTQIQNSN